MSTAISFDLTLRTRTIIAQLLQTHYMLGKAYTPPPNTTLNEAYQIYTDGVIPAGQFPKIAYMTYGNGGHKARINAQNITFAQPVKKLATDMNLCNPLPWVLREISSDLTAAERSNLAGRREIDISGTTYVAYMLRAIPNIADVTPVVVQKQIVNGQIQTTPYTFPTSSLTPVLPTIDAGGSVGVNGLYVGVDAIADASLDSWLINEMLNVAEILYGTKEDCVISEAGLVSAHQQTRTITPSSGSIYSMTEAICAQILSHYSGYQPIAYGKQTVPMRLSLGALDPLFYSTK